jgi:spore germination cell wall hydrolase CwlJ-like protein
MKYLTPTAPSEAPASAIINDIKTEADSAGFQSALNIDVLARTMWGEARGEGSAGMQAVANVVINRTEIGGWWGNSIIEVCQKPFQFSCWNKDDPNFGKVLSVERDDLYFATAMRIAQRALYGHLPDITNRADHYHAAGILPYWAKGEKPVTVLGNHIFYRLTKP